MTYWKKSKDTSVFRFYCLFVCLSMKNQIFTNYKIPLKSSKLRKIKKSFYYRNFYYKIRTMYLSLILVSTHLAPTGFLEKFDVNKCSFLLQPFIGKDILPFIIYVVRSCRIWPMSNLKKIYRWRLHIKKVMWRNPISRFDVHRKETSNKSDFVFRLAVIKTNCFTQCEQFLTFFLFDIVFRSG